MKRILLILLAAAGAFFSLTFVVYITNADMKLVEVIYNKLMAYHHQHPREEKL